MYALGVLLCLGVVVGGVVFIANDAIKTSRTEKYLEKEMKECIRKQKEFYGMNDD